MAPVDRTYEKHNVQRIKTSKPKNLVESRNLNKSFRSSPDAATLQARQDEIGEARRSVAVPAAPAKAAAAGETVSDEPEASIKLGKPAADTAAD
jgi:hypothetical protein